MDTSVLVPVVPVVWSQAQNVTEPLVAFWLSGMRRRRSVDRSRRAELVLTEPTAVQVLPLSVEYCQVPVPLERSVTAMPFTAPASTSLTCPEMSVETRSPLLVVWSSLMVVKLLAPDSTGASL